MSDPPSSPPVLRMDAAGRAAAQRHMAAALARGRSHAEPFLDAHEEALLRAKMKKARRVAVRR